MRLLAGIGGAAVLVVVLWDAFETIVLPRRVSRRLRLTRLFYGATWRPWAASARLVRNGNRRELYLSFYGPLSLVLLLALWAAGLVAGFGLLQYANGSAVQLGTETGGLSTDLYLSGTTFFTLGLGDVVPRGSVARLLTVVESGLGFGFLAIVIGYFPVIYQAFSRREANISLLDARAGSPSSATELLRRHYRDQHVEELLRYLLEWEKWSAELLESHLSYPVLTYYRSQHERQSWLAALTTVLDACALLIVGFEDISTPTVRFSFAIARHAAVDLAQVYGTPPMNPKLGRLSHDDFARMRDSLAEVGLTLQHQEDAEQRLYDIRRAYEPFVNAIANHLLLSLPPWIQTTKTVDDWQTSAWDHFAQWSPEKLDEITHIIVDHRKKAPVGHSHPHTHKTDAGEHSSDGGEQKVSSG